MTKDTPEYEPIITPGALIKRKRQRWLWDNVIPLNAPTLLAGRGGIGKSTVAAWLIGQLTQGKLPGDFYGEPVPVGIIAGEDDKDMSLEPRLAAAGADPKLWSVLEVAPPDGEPLPPTLHHLPLIVRMIEETGLKVLIADPLISMQAGDSHKLSAVREELNPLYSLCQKRGISMVWVHHFNKGTGDASNLISGSHAYRDIAKSVLLLAEDEDTGQRILSIDKGNYIADKNRKSWAFTIEDAELPVEGDDMPAIVGRAILQGESTLTVSDIVRRDVRNLGDFRLELLDFAADKAGQLFTIGEAAEAIGAEITKTKVYLGRMVSAGELEKPARGRYGITQSGLAKVNRQREAEAPREQAAGAGSQSGIASVTTPTGGNEPAPVALITELKPKRGTYGTECPTHNYPTYKGDCAKCAAERAGVEIG